MNNGNNNTTANQEVNAGDQQAKGLLRRYRVGLALLVLAVSNSFSLYLGMTLPGRFGNNNDLVVIAPEGSSKGVCQADSNKNGTSFKILAVSDARALCSNEYMKTYLAQQEASRALDFEIEFVSGNVARQKFEQRDGTYQAFLFNAPTMDVLGLGGSGPWTEQGHKVIPVGEQPVSFAVKGRQHYKALFGNKEFIKPSRIVRLAAEGVIELEVDSVPNLGAGTVFYEALVDEVGEDSELIKLFNINRRVLGFNQAEVGTKQNVTLGESSDELVNSGRIQLRIVPQSDVLSMNRQLQAESPTGELDLENAWHMGYVRGVSNLGLELVVPAEIANESDDSPRYNRSGRISMETPEFKLAGVTPSLTGAGLLLADQGSVTDSSADQIVVPVEEGSTETPVLPPALDTESSQQPRPVPITVTVEEIFTNKEFKRFVHVTGINPDKSNEGLWDSLFGNQKFPEIEGDVEPEEFGYKPDVSAPELEIRSNEEESVIDETLEGYEADRLNNNRKFVFDLSKSMVRDNRYELAKQAILEISDAETSPAFGLPLRVTGDCVEYIPFGEVVRKSQKGCSAEEIKSAANLTFLQNQPDGNYTAFFDGVMAAYESIHADRQNRERPDLEGGASSANDTLIAFTDGKDNRSTHTIDEIHAFVRDNNLGDVHLVVIGYGNPEEPDNDYGGYMLDLQSLSNLVDPLNGTLCFGDDFATCLVDGASSGG